MYDRHAMVYTRTKAWSTMALPEPSDYLNAVAKCDIHLLHMGRGIYGRLKRKPLIAPPRNLVSHPKIHVKIDKRRKTARVEDLSCHDKLRNEDWCEGEEYLDYESDDSHCNHTTNVQTCTKLHSDTETDSSLASLIVQTNWSEDEVSTSSELSDHSNNMEESEKEHEPCPIHGNAVDIIHDMNVRNIKPFSPKPRSILSGVTIFRYCF